MTHSQVVFLAHVVKPEKYAHWVAYMYMYRGGERNGEWIICPVAPPPVHIDIALPSTAVPAPEPPTNTTLRLFSNLFSPRAPLR